MDKTLVTLLNVAAAFSLNDFPTDSHLSQSGNLGIWENVLNFLSLEWIV